MFYLGDLFQWERFITPSIIRLFYWLMVVIILLSGLSGLFAAIGLLRVSLLNGAVTAAVSLIGTLFGILFARILTEFILMIFSINEHLSAIRNRGGM
jgi:hypothetical protein